jgi:hypothetical protein
MPRYFSCDFLYLQQFVIQHKKHMKQLMLTINEANI